MQNTRLQKLTAAAMLIAVGVVIPLFSPVKLIIEPASFTLASHVAIFLAMFISPSVAVAVALGTTAGFFLAMFPLVVVLRAASHLVFAFFGALWLQKHPTLMQSPVKTQIFSFCIAVVHAACEVVVSAIFYFRGGATGGFAVTVLGLVGLGGIAHSMVDFAIALIVVYALRQQKALRKLFPYELTRRGA